MKKWTWIAGAAAALGGAAWLGLKVPPAPYPTKPPGRDLGDAPLPEGLPAPVHRFYRAVAQFPRVESAYANGRGRILMAPEPAEVWVPVRWELYLEPGRQFRWTAEGTWFGLPVLQGGDEIVNGEARFAIAGQVLTGDATYKAEYMILWLYTLAVCPTALLTMPAVRWETVDDVTARLYYPYAEDEEWHFTLHFDPASSALSRVTTERFDIQTGGFRPYQSTFGVRRSMAGTSLPVTMCVAWGDAFYFYGNMEHVSYNIDLPFPTA